MSKKIHPHLKHFLRGVILQQVSTTMTSAEGKKDLKLIEGIVFLFYEELFRLGIENASTEEEKQAVVDKAQEKMLQTINAALKTAGDSFKGMSPELWRTNG